MDYLKPYIQAVGESALGFAQRAAVAHVLPFAGTRHQAYLLPFLAAGIAATFACLQRRHSTILLLVGAVIAPFWAAVAIPDNNSRILRRSDMTGAIEYLHGTVTPPSPLFVDESTRLVLMYYLARKDKSLDRIYPRPIEQWLGGYHVVVPGEYTWIFRPDAAISQATQSARAMGLRPGASLVLVSVSWVAPSLASQLAPGGIAMSRNSGESA